MTQTPTIESDAPAAPSLPARYASLTKARLSAMVLLTTAAGYVVAAAGRFDWATLLWTVLGSAAAAGSASAFNQLLEVDRDARMERTRARPLPSGAMGRRHAFVVAILLAYAGLSVLAMKVNLLAAGLALLTILLYVFLYTPMKATTTLNTLVGAVCGAIPPMIGWVAARGALEPGAWVLAALLLVWQLPHFMALAWLYRDDYARGGFRMLPNVDERGELTARVAVLACLVLLAIGFAGLVNGVAGWLFASGTLLAGIWFALASIDFYRDRTNETARRLFRRSLLYLPIVLLLLVVDRGPAAGLPRGEVIQAEGGPVPAAMTLPLAMADRPAGRSR